MPTATSATLQPFSRASREVHWKFKLSPETLFLTVHLLDRSRGETAADLRHAAQHIRHIDPNPVNTF